MWSLNISTTLINSIAYTYIPSLTKMQKREPGPVGNQNMIRSQRPWIPSMQFLHFQPGNRPVQLVLRIRDFLWSFHGGKKGAKKTDRGGRLTQKRYTKSATEISNWAKPIGLPIARGIFPIPVLSAPENSSKRTINDSNISFYQKMWKEPQTDLRSGWCVFPQTAFRRKDLEPQLRIKFWYLFVKMPCIGLSCL